MTKQYLYIVDSLATLNPRTDTTLALMKEAKSRGIDNFACEIKDIFLSQGKLWFMSAPVADCGAPAYIEKLCPRPADQFLIIFMRKDPPVDERFLSALLMLRYHDPKKSKMLNDPAGIMLANEKLFGYQIAGKYFPPTLVACDKAKLMAFIDEQECAVLKPLFYAGGSSILVFDRRDRNLASALEILTQRYSMPIMVQSYIANVREGDKRILVLGGKPIGAVMRVPKSNDHRANFHAGGRAKACKLDARDLEIVTAIAPHLVALGLHFVGIDVIGGYLTEINVTSPTCLIEIESLSQEPHEQPLRSQVLDYVDGLLRN